MSENTKNASENLPEKEGKGEDVDEKRRFEELFGRLDANKDGTIDVKELTAALRGGGDAHSHAKVIHSHLIYIAPLYWIGWRCRI